MVQFPLQNRTAVVTGASAGIGRAIAGRLVNLGAFCVINGRRPERLADAAKEFREGNIAQVVGDCADDAVITRMLDVARLALGNPELEADLVVVNAGRGLSGSVLTSDPSQWEEMIRTNVTGAAKLIRAAAQRMLAQIERRTGGRFGPDALARPHDIVVIGSTVGRHISPFSSMYGSTKFAVNSLAEAARRELGPKGIRVTLIEPGFVESEFQGVAGYDPAWFAEVKARIGPVLSPEDVADSVGYVVSRPAHVHLSDVLIRPTRQEYP